MERSIFDTHAHYDDEAFNEDRDNLLSSLPAKGVYRVINAGTDIKSSEFSMELAQKYDYIYFAVGLHPEELADFNGDFEPYRAEIENLASHKKAVAIGEIGLDYHYEDGAEREVQISVFEQQLSLANRINKPVIVHDRDAHGDTLELLKKYKPQGVLHCFSGSVEMLQEVLKLGMYIGIGGAVTFKNAKKIIKVTQALPMNRLLLETDAPYMSPEPYRGKRCDSAKIEYVAEKIAEIKCLTKAEVLRLTAENARRCFNIE